MATNCAVLLLHIYIYFFISNMRYLAWQQVLKHVPYLISIECDIALQDCLLKSLDLLGTECKTTVN